MIFAHSSITDQHFTPPNIVNACKSILRTIDLDPCSDYDYNLTFIKATKIFTSSGLEYLSEIPDDSNLRVWCNPPGGKTKNESNMKLWLYKILECYERKAISEAFFLMFNREFLGLEEIKFLPKFHFTERLKYWSYNEILGEFQEGNWKTNSDASIFLVKDGDDWSLMDKNGYKFESGSKTFLKKIHEIHEKYEKNGIREWTNAPSHQSTLIYLPSEVDKTKELIETFEAHQIKGYWTIPVKY